MVQCDIIPEVCSLVIAKFCTGPEIAQFCRLNKQNNQYYNSEDVWASVFQRDFPTLEKQGTWRKSYLCLATFLGTALDDFQECAESFRTILAWVKDNTPAVYDSCVDPYAYVDLLDAYTSDGFSVPDIVRVLYVLSRGQKHLPGNQWNHGLFGFYEFYNHRSSLHFMDITSREVEPYIPHILQRQQGWAGIPQKIRGIDMFVFACAPCRGVRHGAALAVRLDTMEIVSMNTRLTEFHKVGNSLPEFLSWYASQLSSSNFDVVDGGIDRFPNSHECNSECITNGVRIKASSLFICGMAEDKRYIFPYKISITATADCEKAQLTTRRWECYEDGRVPDIVEGPGVIGEHPVVEWGMEKFVYKSCTQNRAEKGHMKGHFAFKREKDGLHFNALIEPFRQDLRLTQKF